MSEDWRNELVTKGEAIDALGDMVMNWTDSEYELGQLNQWKADRKAIIDLPSAQPPSCKDAVSKADVLETYAELYDVFDDNKEIKNELHKIYDKINALQAAQPQHNVRFYDADHVWIDGKQYISLQRFGKAIKDAQPETIRCKDCEWWTKQKDSLQGRCALMQMYPTGGWFCANARRKER